MPEPSGGRPDDVIVLYVGGVPRGGTTLLDLMVGQLPGHVAVGELFYLWQTGLERDRLCGCGQPFSRCEFWSAVGERAFGGWDKVDLAATRSLAAAVDRTKYLPLLLYPRLDRSFARRLCTYQEQLAAVYSAIRDVSGCSVIVDSSKRPSLAYALRTADGVDLRLVHLVRDPRGVVYSWSKSVKLPAGAGARDHLKVRSAREVTRRWITVNAMIAGLLRLGVPGVTLRYEDLVTSPRDALRTVAQLSSSMPTDPDLNFVSEDGLHLHSSHSVAGGRIRFNSSPMRLQLDERWRREMPQNARRVVGTMTWPMRMLYGYR